jgi:hypothetical protein
MKFNTFIAIALCFLVLNSYFILAKTKIKRNLSSRRIKNLNFANKFHTHLCQKEAKDDDFDVLHFTFGFLKTVKSSFLAEMKKNFKHGIQERIREQIEDPSQTQEFLLGCNRIMKEKFEEIIEAKMNEVENVIETGVASLSEELHELNLNNEQKLSLEQKKDNPKALCEESMRILKEKQQSTQLDQRIVDQMIFSLRYTMEDGLKKKFTDLNSFKHYLDCTFCAGTHRKGKHLLLDYIKNNVESESNLQGEAFKQKMIEVRNIIQGEQSHHTLYQTRADAIEKISCKDLPQQVTEGDKCNRLSLGSKVAALLTVMKSREFLECSALEFLKGFTIKKILELVFKIIVNIFAGILLKGLIIIYNVHKVYYYYKIASDKTNNVKKRSRAWGTSAGYLVRIVLDLLPTSLKKK